MKEVSVGPLILKLNYSGLILRFSWAHEIQKILRIDVFFPYLLLSTSSQGNFFFQNFSGTVHAQQREFSGGFSSWG